MQFPGVHRRSGLTSITVPSDPGIKQNIQTKYVAGGTPASHAVLVQMLRFGLDLQVIVLLRCSDGCKQNTQEDVSQNCPPVYWMVEIIMQCHLAAPTLQSCVWLQTCDEE